MRATSAELEVAAKIRYGVTTFAARARSERRGELSLNQTAVLGLLRKSGPITPGEIAQRLRIKPQGLTRTFAGLAESGFVVRMPDPGDGRQSLLTITAAGLEALAAEMRPRDEWVAAALERELTGAEIGLLVVAAALLERLAEVDADVARTEP